MALQTIELEIKNEAEEGVFALSHVLDPAIEDNYVALSKNQIELKVVDEERRIVVGFALIPDKVIPRRQEIDGTMREFNIKIPRKTVSKAAELYMKNLNGNNVTIVLTPSTGLSCSIVALLPLRFFINNSPAFATVCLENLILNSRILPLISWRLGISLSGTKAKPTTILRSSSTTFNSI